MQTWLKLCVCLFWNTIPKNIENRRCFLLSQTGPAYFGQTLYNDIVMPAGGTLRATMTLLGFFRVFRVTRLRRPPLGFVPPLLRRSPQTPLILLLTKHRHLPTNEIFNPLPQHYPGLYSILYRCSLFR